MEARRDRVRMHSYVCTVSIAISLSCSFPPSQTHQLHLGTIALEKR